MAVRELSPARCTSASPLVLARRTKLFALSEMRWAALALGLFSAGLLTQLCGAPQWVRWALFLACYATGGWEPGLAGLQALQRRTLDVDLLMVVAAIGAAAIGQIAEGALLIVIFATSGALEALVTARTADSVRGLMGLAPGTATRVGAGGGEETVNAADLRIGDIVLVRPGERISADATVLAGGSEVDQATVTGEPLPVDKSIGDQVFAGTVNGTGALRIRVDRLARDSVVARIATLVEQASQTKARTQLFIEKVEQRYSIGMVAVTLAVFAVPPLWGDPAAGVAASHDVHDRRVAVCGRAGHHAATIGRNRQRRPPRGARQVRDRDGTTWNHHTDRVRQDRHPYPRYPELAGIWVYERRFTDDELLRLAAAAEYPSEHPLGAAIVKAAQSRRIRLPTVGEFTAHPGCRVTARVDGHVIAVGSATALLGTAGAAALEASMITAVDFLQGEGYTVVVVVCDSHPVGLLAITDQLRPEAAAAISAATKLTGAKPVLLTGDNRATADRLGVQVGIDDVRAGLLPDDKVAAVRQLQAGGARLTVVGDGINDAPALAAAHVGIAMGSARSELTLQTADAVVARDDLTTIPTIIAMSRRARRIVVANLIVAVTFIAGLVVWDLAFTLPLPLGVARHEGSTIIVGLNALRLLRHTAWRRAAGTAHR